MKKYLPILFFLFLNFAFQTNARESQEKIAQIPVQNTTTPKDSLALFLKHYEGFFKTNFNVSECPGAAVVIVKDNTVVYKKGFGVKKIHTTDSVDVNSVFRIASLSKGVSAVLAGHMVDKNELQWNQFVKDAVPTFGLKEHAQAARLQVRHLLSHTTGIYKYTFTKLIQKGLSLDQMIPSFNRIGVVAKEGEKYGYQNVVFSIIEKVMEKNTKKSFDDLLKERLFDPAGMTNASTTYTAIKANTNVALPHGYNCTSNKYWVKRIHPNYYNVAAAGGVNASISDMGEYLKVLLGNRPDIISKASLNEIFNPVVCTEGNSTYLNLWDGVTAAHYAMGWRVMDYKGRRIIYHGGNVNQYKTQLLVDPDNGIAICILFNGPNSFNGPAIPTFLSYYDFYKAMSK